MKGPCLLDLQLLANTSIETMSFIFTVCSIFGLAGAIIIGIVMEKINPWFLMGTLLFVQGVAFIAIPWCPHYLAMMIVAGVTGFCGAGYDSSE